MIKLSELLKVGKEFSDVPQSFLDSAKTESKITEIREAMTVAGGLIDNTGDLQSNPLGASIATSIGAMIETLREYAGDNIEIDLYDGSGNLIFPAFVPPADPPA